MIPDRHFSEKQSKTHKKIKDRIAYSLDEVLNTLLTLNSKQVSGNNRPRNSVTIPIPDSDYYTAFISLLIKQLDAVPCLPGTAVCTNLSFRVSSSSSPCSKSISGRYLVVQLIRITVRLLCLVCSVLATLSWYFRMLNTVEHSAPTPGTDCLCSQQFLHSFHSDQDPLLALGYSS